MTASPSLAGDEIKSSARWHVHQVSVTGTAEVVSMTNQSYAASSFLDHRIVLPEAAIAHNVKFSSLHQFFGDPAGNETRFLFHISHVGSTLLSKALGVAPECLCLREPILLRWLSDIRRDLHLPESRYNKAAYRQLLCTIVGLLARPLGEEKNVIVKATSYASNLADDILNCQPRSRAVGIYSRFEIFAANVLKGMGGWQDMLSQAPKRMQRLHSLLGRQPWQLAYLSPGEIVALNWLTEMTTLSLAESRHRDRFTWIEFDSFLSDSSKNMSGIARQLGLAWGKREDKRLAVSGIMETYSKGGGREYSAASRKIEIAALAEQNAAEIEKGRAWLDRALNDHQELRIVQPFAAISQDLVAA